MTLDQAPGMCSDPRLPRLTDSGLLMREFDQKLRDHLGILLGGQLLVLAPADTKQRGRLAGPRGADALLSWTLDLCHFARPGPLTSKIDDDVISRPRTAYQEVTIRRRLERHRIIADVTGNQTTLAAMAHPSAA